MKKIFGLFSILTLAMVLCFSDFLNAHAGKVEYIHADYTKDYDNLNLEDEYDYVFLGEVTEYVTTSQYNGHGSNIPYSYFKVKVLNITKGILDENITIKFYGGYDEEGVLLLIEDLTYPELNKKYQFYCNKSLLSLEQDGRTFQDSYVISTKFNMQEITEEKVENPQVKAQNISPFSFELDKDPGAGGGGGGGYYPNRSFATAKQLTINQSELVDLTAGLELYYKVRRSTLDYLSVYSKGVDDTMVEVYDSSYKLIGSNDNVLTEREKQFTSDKNFFYNFYANKNETYYFKVKFKDTTLKSRFGLYVIVDNWYTSNPSDLFWEYNGVQDDVDGVHKVRYNSSSKYTNEINYAVKEWSKLETVKFIGNSNLSIYNLTFSDYTDVDSDTIAFTRYAWIFGVDVCFNVYKMDRISQKCRNKTSMHEVGHVLGIDEFTGKEARNNVMHQGELELEKLGPADIAIYRIKWYA